MGQTAGGFSLARYNAYLLFGLARFSRRLRLFVVGMFNKKVADDIQCLG
jgi:hypothetical protein